MDLYNAVLGNIARKYAAQTEQNTEIILEKNEANTGGHCLSKTFIAGVLYKVVVPVLLTSPENYILVLSSGEGPSYKSFGNKEKGEILIEYEHDTTSFFLFFKKTMNCTFFTNRIPHN